MTSIVRRIGSALLIIWLAATLTFFALRILPGDAIAAQLAQAGASRTEIEERRAELGLDAPVLVQYMRFIGDALRGNLGYSILSGQPVTDLILQNLLPTAALAGNALALAAILGLLLGTVAAVDQTGSSLAQIAIHLSLSTPIYWTGTMAIYVFSAQLGLLPSAGAGRVSQLVLPVIVLGFHTAGVMARVVEANVRETMTAPFVQVARAKGLPEYYILGRHVLRASLLPFVTVVALQAGFLLSGAVVTESLFVRPGIGRLLLDATLKQDYPIVQGIVIFSASVYTVVNSLADSVYRLVDPRIAD